MIHMNDLSSLSSNMVASSSVARSPRWSEPQLKSVAVLYYLSRNGQLDHPHFMEVPLSSPRGLFLKDVINRLNALRGKGMAFMYSWSCKRSYKNGFVWHDLSENDLIIPAHGHDYILKGSAFLDVGSPPPPPHNRTSAQHYTRRRNQSCSSIDFDSKSADVSTQTDTAAEDRLSDSKELEIEISPPPSDSSPETLGTLMKEVRLRGHRHHHIQRCRSSMVLMQLISCGSMPFKDCGTRSDQAMVGGQHKLRAPRGKLEEKDYFSGSIVETKKREFPALKRSNSYNADRTLNLEVAEKEMEKLKAKCIPIKTKAHSSTKKEGSISTTDGYA